MGIGVGVTLGAVAVLAGLLVLLWKAGMLSGIIGGGGTAGAAGGTAAGGTEAMQTVPAAKPLLMGSNSTGTAALGAVTGAAVVGGAAGAAGANAANGTNAANVTNTTSDPATATADQSLTGINPGDVGMSNAGAGHAGTGSSGVSGLTAVGNSGVSGLAGTGSSEVGGLTVVGTSGVTGLASAGGSGVSGIAGPTSSSGVSGLAGTGSHHAGGMSGFFGAIGLRKKKSKDEKQISDQTTHIDAAGLPQQPLTGELDGGRNQFVPDDKKHEISGEQIHEADE